MAAAVGIMAIKLDKTANGKGRIHFIFGHTTDSMVSYFIPSFFFLPF